MAFPSKQKILYEQLDQELRKSYSPGDRLPAERVLAAKYGVARMTLRGALERLVHEHRIIRRWNGTFLLGRKNEDFAANDRNDIRIYVLLPCPSYATLSGFYSYMVTTAFLRGALTAAVRHGFHVLTIPVSQTNEPDEIDWDELSLIREDDIVLFAGDWYSALFPLLSERNCKVGAILPKMDESVHRFLQETRQYRIYTRPILANYLPEVLADIKKKKRKKVFLFGRHQFSMFIHGKIRLQDFLAEQTELAAPCELKVQLCRETTSFAEQCMLVREAFEKESFDALIFDSESDPGGPVSLRELCRLSESVLIYVRGKNLLGRDEKSRNNLCYSRSCFMECAEEIVEYFLSARDVKSGIFDFKHIITGFNPNITEGVPE